MDTLIIACNNPKRSNNGRWELQAQRAGWLVQLGPVETEQGLHAEGIRKIQEVLNRTLADARTTVRELRVRKRIEETTTPIEQLDQPHF